MNLTLKSFIHYALLVLLTSTSGCVDAISFLGLGQVFTAAMTGNTVLFGLAAVHTGGLTVSVYAAALLGFILGAAVAATIYRRTRKTTGWTPVVTVAIVIELAALVLFALVTTWVPVAAPGAQFSFVVILAFAMGIQGVTARRIGVYGVTTTVITSTLTGLVETSVWKLAAFRSANPVRDKTQPENQVSTTSLSMWILVIIAYGIGAACCGALEVRWHFHAIWLPIAIVFVVAVASVATLARAEGEKRTEMSL